MSTTSLTLLDLLGLPNQHDAWARFVRLYTPLLLIWVRRQNIQEADAADLVQETLLKLIRVLPTYERGKNQTFRGWLYRVTSNQCRDFYRRQATRALLTLDDRLEIATESLMTLKEETEYRQLLVKRGLEVVRPDFNETTWAAFMGVMLDGRSAVQVALELRISENAVYLARHRILTRLRQELDGMLE